MEEYMHSSIAEIVEAHLNDRFITSGADIYDLTKEERKILIDDTILKPECTIVRYLFDGKSLSDAKAHFAHKKDKDMWYQYDHEAVFSVPIEGFKTTQEAYHFHMEPTVSVDVLTKQEDAPSFISKIASSSGYNAKGILDLEFVERYYADELLMADWSNRRTGVWGLHSRFSKNYFKMKKMDRIQNINNVFYSDDECHIIDEVESDRADTSKFTGFADKEKIHIKLLEYSKKGKRSKRDGSMYIPVFIGIGNNYPFTRKINSRTGYGDDRFYRESFDIGNDTMTVQQYTQGRDGTWSSQVNVLQPQELEKKLKADLADPKLAKLRLINHIDKAQSVYPQYFDNVFSIDDVYRKYVDTMGLQYDPSKIFRDKRLMLNPATRIRACALVAYDKMDEML